MTWAIEEDFFEHALKSCSPSFKITGKPATLAPQIKLLCHSHCVLPRHQMVVVSDIQIQLRVT